MSREKYLELCEQCRKYGNKGGWVGYKYKELFGEWPEWEEHKDIQADASKKKKPMSRDELQAKFPEGCPTCKRPWESEHPF